MEYNSPTQAELLITHGTLLTMNDEMQIIPMQGKEDR